MSAGSIVATMAMTLVLGHEIAGQQALPTGTAQQLQYLDNELSMFMHFSICTDMLKTKGS